MQPRAFMTEHPEGSFGRLFATTPGKEQSSQENNK
jgi:hypothetical protein